jgi:hypothetical protein
MKTHINQGPRGWSAQTDIPTLSSVIRIVTERDIVGLVTSMTRHRLDHNGRMGQALDEGTTLTRSHPLAITRHAVQNQHEAAVRDIEDRMQEMALHYAGVAA